MLRNGLPGPRNECPQSHFFPSFSNICFSITAHIRRCELLELNIYVLDHGIVIPPI